MIKFFLKIAILAFLIVMAFRFFSAESTDPLVSFKSENGHFSLAIREKEKEWLKNPVKKIKEIIYQEATKHNPPGDMLPDQIDDQILGKIKETIN